MLLDLIYILIWCLVITNCCLSMFLVFVLILVIQTYVYDLHYHILSHSLVSFVLSYCHQLCVFLYHKISVWRPLYSSLYFGFIVTLCLSRTLGSPGIRCSGYYMQDWVKCGFLHMPSYSFNLKNSELCGCNIYESSRHHPVLHVLIYECGVLLLSEEEA